MYVAGDYYRGAYRKPPWGLEHAAPVGAWGKPKNGLPPLAQSPGLVKRSTTTGQRSGLFLAGGAALLA